MADHFARTESLLAELDELRKRLREEHLRQPAPRAKAVAALYDEIRHVTKVAGVHAQLAQCQAISDQTMQAAS